MRAPDLGRSRFGPGRIVVLLAAGATMQAGWLLLWSVSRAARVMADIADPWSAEPGHIMDWLLGWVVLAGQRFPETGPFGGLSVAANLAIALSIVGIGYLAAVIAMDRGLAVARGAMRVIVGFMLLFQLTLVVMPGVFSTDVFSYLMYGQMAGVHGLNPYVTPPDVLVGNPLLSWIYDDWRSLPSPYGPLWTAFTASTAPWLYMLDVSDQVLLHKLFMNGVHVLNVGLLAWLLKRSLSSHARGARLTAMTLFAWNPLLLLEVAGNGHNDGLMLTLLLASLVPIAGQRAADAGPRVIHNMEWLGSFFLIGLSALVKFATVLVGIVEGVVWARQLSDWRSRARWLTASGVLVLGVGLALYWPWLAGASTFSAAFDEISGKFEFHSLPVVVQRLVGEWLASVTDLPPDTAARLAQAGVYGVCRVFFLVYLMWELGRVWSSREQRAPIEVVSAVSARACCWWCSPRSTAGTSPGRWRWCHSWAGAAT